MTEARTAERETRGSGLVLVLGGAALVLISFRFLDWYDVSMSGADTAGDPNFPALRDSAQQLGGAGVALAYFTWLSWALLVAVAVCGAGAAAALPGAVAPAALRLVGFFAGLLGVVATYYALAQHQNAVGSHHGVFHNAAWGVWTALAGFALAGFGAALGPKRVAS